MSALLEVRNLQISFFTDEGEVRAVDGVSFAIQKGETLALVGESGCGKSVTALSLAKLVATPPGLYKGGEILLDGEDVLQMSKDRLRQIRGAKISYIFQEPATSLNPVFRIGWQIKEVLQLHRPDAATDAEVVRLLKLVRIPDPECRLRDYPHQLSGGMQQRVMIAMALACNPGLLVADEPTTALDVTIQAQILDLLKDLKREIGMSILLITHNLGIVGDLADNVCVMYAGRVVEQSPAAELLKKPLHPYTIALMRSIPRLGARADRLQSIPGTVPSAARLPAGCKFAPRCDRVQPDCARDPEPELINGRVRCPYWEKP
ncbi:MAG: Oligopeptide transport ATP-binding protein OppD [Verrucomicrobiae bacterium]|nr:Oligopeptide transport ATP-binding protein OppD [Verrucomicrobiae bacterium]